MVQPQSKSRRQASALSKRGDKQVQPSFEAGKSLCAGRAPGRARLFSVVSLRAKHVSKSFAASLFFQLLHNRELPVSRN